MAEENMRIVDKALEEQLEAMCTPPSPSWKLIPSPSWSWSGEVYGFGRHIRKYGWFPKWLPLCIYTDHSPGDRDISYAHELESPSPVQFYHFPSRVKRWKEISKKPCYCLYSPFVFHRKRNGIERLTDANGTIAFPAHTTTDLDDISNIQLYIDQLKRLPAEYQPVSICLHMVDIQKGLHKEFIANGFDVYTAGHAYDHRFTERFYSIIRKFKYSTSNLGGSYLYYCVEMGMPFFLYGNEPRYINKSDLNIEKGEYTSYKRQEAYLKLLDLFSVMTTTISEEQKTFVNKNLGIYDGLNRVQMSLVLYYALFQSLHWDDAIYMFKAILKSGFNLIGLELSRQGVKKQRRD